MALVPIRHNMSGNKSYWSSIFVFLLRNLVKRKITKFSSFLFVPFFFKIRSNLIEILVNQSFFAKNLNSRKILPRRIEISTIVVEINEKWVNREKSVKNTQRRPEILIFYVKSKFWVINEKI